MDHINQYIINAVLPFWTVWSTESSVTAHRRPRQLNNPSLTELTDRRESKTFATILKPTDRKQNLCHNAKTDRHKRKQRCISCSPEKTSSTKQSLPHRADVFAVSNSCHSTKTDRQKRKQKRETTGRENTDLRSLGSRIFGNTGSFSLHQPPSCRLKQVSHANHHETVWQDY